MSSKPQKLDQRIIGTNLADRRSRLTPRCWPRISG